MNLRLSFAVAWSTAILVTGLIGPLAAQIRAVTLTAPRNHWVVVASPNGPAGPSILEDVAVRAVDDVWAVGATASPQAPPPAFTSCRNVVPTLGAVGLYLPREGRLRAELFKLG